ncbi:MAG: GGDEF domain-containing protein [Oricola sp.]
MKLDWSARGRARVYTLTALGTAICIAFAFAFDSYSFATGTWRLGADPVNNFIIPLLIAPPFFFFLLSKMRQLAIAHTELMTVASTDGLTSLLNRRAFTQMVDGYLQRVQQASTASHDALLVIDVDHFKAVNDRFGHDCGDEALKLVASTILTTVRETDLVARMGGEEFCVFIPNQSLEGISIIAERIRQSINEADFDAHGTHHKLSVSVGGVAFEKSQPFGDLYRVADERLYDAKRNGRNRVELRILQPGAANQPTVH